MQADLYNGRKTVVLTPPQNTLMWHINNFDENLSIMTIFCSNAAATVSYQIAINFHISPK